MNSRINRRAFLLSPLALKNPSYEHKAILSDLKTTENGNTSSVVFVSNNKKFVHVIQYTDAGCCVKLEDVIAWYDPITDKQMSKTNQTLFITESKDSI